MEFKFIDDIIPGLTLNLNVLKRATEPYTMSLYQHEGQLVASDQKIGNGTEVSVKLRSYLNLIKEKDTDLALIPEYCCPFTLLNEIIIDSNKWPSSNKLWVIGMESIQKEELVSYLKTLDTDETLSYYDTRVLNDNKTFLNPLIYMFKAVKDGSQKLIIIIQFKNYHMGVWSGGDKERDNMIPGNEIYILRNNKLSVNLMSVICSEAMNLSTVMTPEIRASLLWGELPFLVLNPQVNPGPNHPNFLNFRNFVLSSQRTEIIALNWNNESKVLKEDLLPSKFARSGIYTRTSDMIFKNLERVRNNHKLGLYYFYYGTDRHSFLVNSKAQAYFFQNTSVNINEGVAAQQMRNGPHLLSTYVFDENDNLLMVNEVSDNHIDYLKSVGCTNAFLSDPENCVIEKELLACISTGEIPEKSAKNWSDLNNIWSVKSLENSDINRRITVAEDKDEDSTKIRDRYVQLVEILDSEIIKNPDYLPDSVSDLRSEQLFLGFSKERNSDNKRLVGLQFFRCNMTTIKGEMVRATVCYLDMASDEKIGRVFKALQSMFDYDSRDRDRVVVFYKKGGNYFAKTSESSNNITKGESKSENSFLK